MFFSKFTSPEQFYAAVLHQDTQHQKPLALQTDGNSMQRHLPQQEIQKTVCQYRLPVQLITTRY
jgi:hypothetical protein